MGILPTRIVLDPVLGSILLGWLSSCEAKHHVRKTSSFHDSAQVFGSADRALYLLANAGDKALVKML